MTTYIKYQCTVCRREKTIEQDPVRVAPNPCTITKGCAGILQALGVTSSPINVTPVSGLEDWYPRGSKTVNMNTTPAQESVGLVSSSTGAIAIALKEQNEASLPSYLELVFEQRRSESVAYSEYTYRPTNPTSVFTGKDVSGKILRIDAAAISENRIQVRVNGVLTDAYVPTANTITLNSPATGVVNIRVQAEKETITRVLHFDRTSLLVPSVTRGPWANINIIRHFTPGVGFQTWWVYSIESIAGLGVGKLRLVDTGTANEVMVLLAHTPFTSFDRYMNFIVPTANLMSDDFPISVEPNTRADLLVDRSLVSEIYPPMRLEGDAFIEPEARVTESSSAIVTDDVNVLLTGTKVLGPV